MLEPNYSLFSQAILEKIHDTALEILEKKGVKVDNAEAVRICKAGGAVVDNDGIVKYPSSMVRDVLNMCKSKISLFHRNTDQELVIGDGCTKYNVSGWTQQILDWKTGKRRAAFEEDIIEYVKVLSALDEINWARAPLICSEWKHDEIELRQYKIGVEHSNKPLLLSASNGETVNKLVELGSVLVGGKKELEAKPHFAVSIGITSPFLLTENFCDVAINCAKYNIPICFYTSSMAGATTPVTLSGTVVCNHAELISAIVIAKLVNPNAKILYLNYSKPFDMQHANISSGSPEFGLLASAQTQTGKFIGVPSGTGMFYTGSSHLDIQVGFEKMGGALLPALSRADFSCGIGGLENAKTHSLEALVIDVEMVGYISRILKGMNCENEHFGFEIFRDMRPGDDFLTSDHTLKYFRTELYRSRFAYKGSDSSLVADGESASIKNNARKFIEYTLENYQSPGVSDSFMNEFEKMIL